MTNFEKLQDALIGTIKSRGVVSEEVLEVINKVDRREFVSETFVSRAFEDIALPILGGQTISQPTIVGLMTQALEIKRSNRVLEVGTGSGYQTMILSHLCRHVYSIERYRALAYSAQKLVVNKHKRQNVSIVYADGTRGLPDAAPFDKILVTAASEDIPPTLLQQLKIGGIMVLPLGRSNLHQSLVQVVKKSTKDHRYNDLGRVRFVPLLEGVRDEKLD